MLRLSEWQKYVNEEKIKASTQIDKEIIHKSDDNESLEKQFIVRKNKEFDIGSKQGIFKRITNQLQFENLQPPYRTNAANMSSSYLDKQNFENKANKHINPNHHPAEAIVDIKNKQKEKKNLERQELLNRLLDPILTLEEASKILNVSKTTLRRYTKAGKIKYYVTPGNHRRFKLNDIIGLIK